MCMKNWGWVPCVMLISKDFFSWSLVNCVYTLLHLFIIKWDIAPFSSGRYRDTEIKWPAWRYEIRLIRKAKLQFRSIVGFFFCCWLVGAIFPSLLPVDHIAIEYNCCLSTTACSPLLSQLLNLPTSLPPSGHIASVNFWVLGIVHTMQQCWAQNL